MTDAPKLKPCPFCGNSDVKKSSVTGGIFCEECGCDGPWSPFFEGDWNTRADLIDMDVLQRVEAAGQNLRAFARLFSDDPATVAINEWDAALTAFQAMMEKLK